MKKLLYIPAIAAFGIVLLSACSKTEEDKNENSVAMDQNTSPTDSETATQNSSTGLAVEEIKDADRDGKLELVDTLHEELYSDLPPADQRARNLYETNCKLCHGLNGSLGKFGAANLQRSTMLYTDKLKTIKIGKGRMEGFSGKLTDEEINLIAGYLVQLKK